MNSKGLGGACLQAVSLVTILGLMYGAIHAVAVGSSTTLSRQPFVVFPGLDSNNNLYGVAAFDAGFVLEDMLTTCTFNNFMTVNGPVTLGGGGSLYMTHDFMMGSNGDLTNVGKFFARGNSLLFGSQTSDIKIPSTGICGSIGFQFVNTFTMNTAIQSVDFSYDAKYIAAISVSAASGPELRILYFDGSTLTSTQSVNQDRIWNDVAWHPSRYYLAVVLDQAGGTQEVRIYRLNVSNGSFSLTDSRSYGAAPGFTAAWHPSGNFLIIGKGDDDGTNEVQLFSFSTGTGLLAEFANFDVNPHRHATIHGSSWSPSGGHVVFGYEKDLHSTGNEQILVYELSGSSLTLSGSAGPGVSVSAVDWSSTGSFIAAGLEGTGNTVRIYKHDFVNKKLIEQPSARLNTSRIVGDIRWSNDGNYLLVSYNDTVRPQTAVYCFDKDLKTLSIVNGLLSPSDTAATDARWSLNANYIVRGTAGNHVSVYKVFRKLPLVLDNGTLDLSSNATLHVPIHVRGACKITGGSGHRLWLQDLAEIVVRPAASLEIEGLHISGLRGSRLRCMNDTGSIILRNSILSLMSDYSFSNGALLFDRAVLITGTSKFTYAAARTSTIAAQGTLMLDRGITFSYAPRVAKPQLLAFGDSAAQLFLQGTTLVSTRTGLLLDSGMLILDNAVTISSQGRNSGEALRLGASLDIRVLGGAVVNLFGQIKNG